MRRRQHVNDTDACTSELQDRDLRRRLRAAPASSSATTANHNNGDGCSANCQFEPKVYQVQVDGLINQNSFCDSIGANRYDGCSVQPVGFTWTDSSPFTPSQILVEFDNGINCVGPETRSTTLNNTSTGSFQSIGGNCFCDPSLGPAPAHTLNQWMFANPGSYVVNGTNTFMLSASASCFGFSNTLFSGEYIRITVFP